MSSLFVPAMVICGRLGTGLTAMTSTIITGCRGHGQWLRKSVSCGLQLIGVGAATDTSSTMATGVRMSVSMVGLVTATVTSAKAMKVDVGTTATFSTTNR